MLLGVLIIFLISETQLENSEHKYTIEIDFLSLHQVNFELKVLRKVSMDFGLTSSLSLGPKSYIISSGMSVGVREYLGEEGFRGFYLHQGLGASLFYDKGNIIPYLTFGGGYKYVEEDGFTVDPFLGLGLSLWPGSGLSLRTGVFFIWPSIDLYLGYTW